MKKLLFYLFLLVSCTMRANAEDGYRLWLRYDKIANKPLYTKYRASLTQLVFPGNSETLNAAREEITIGLKGLLLLDLPQKDAATANGALIIGTPVSSKII